MGGAPRLRWSGLCPPAASDAPACVPGQILVTWTVPVGSTNPPDSATGGAGSPTINNTGFTATASAQVPGDTSIDNIGLNPTTDEEVFWARLLYKF